MIELLNSCKESDVDEMKNVNQHKFQPNYELYIYKVHISIILYSEWYMYIEKFDNKN